MESTGQDLSDEVEKPDPGVTCDVTGQVKHKIFEFPLNAFPPQIFEKNKAVDAFNEMLRLHITFLS